MYQFFFQLFIEAIWCLHWVKYSNPTLKFYGSTITSNWNILHVLFIILHSFSHNLTSHIWYYRKCWDVYWNLKWSSVGLNKHRLHSRSLYWPKPIAGFKRWSMNTTTRGRMCCFSSSDFTHWESSRTKSWTWSTTDRCVIYI